MGMNSTSLIHSVDWALAPPVWKLLFEQANLHLGQHVFEHDLSIHVLISIPKEWFEAVLTRRNHRM